MKTTKQFFIVIPLCAIFLVARPAHAAVTSTSSTPKAPAVVAPADLDSDLDGLHDEEEMNIGSDPHNPDSDGDGFSDGDEIVHGYSPLDPNPTKLEKHIEVDIKAQRLSYFVGDLKLRTIKVSTGLPGHDTPKGQFAVMNKLPIVRYKGVGYDFPNTKWNMMFRHGTEGNFYIHGAYWHNQFGKKKSHGCVNVSYHDVERIYNWADVGTKVMIK